MPLPFRDRSRSTPIGEIEELAKVVITSENQAEQDAAFTAIFNALYPVVVRDIRWQVSDLATAEDLAQDVWVKVARKIGTYEGRGGGFVSWVITIARNTVTEHFRTMKRRSEEPLSPDMWMLSLVPAGDATPEESAEQRDLAEKVAECIGSLSKSSREVLRLRFFVGLTYEQTAEVMGKSVGAVKVAQLRALAKLKTVMPNRDSGMAEYIYVRQPAVRETVPAGATA